MATTFVSPRHNQVFKSSPAIAMPDVFVTPPEEDKIPTWCCFNASEAPSTTNPDLPSFVDALSDLESRSQALYDVSEPFGAPNTIIVSIPSFENATTPDDERIRDSKEPDDFPSRLHHKNASSTVHQSMGNDLDVIEVVKIPRHVAEQEYLNRIEPPHLKRSKSFIMRASKVLRSIKNVARSSARSKLPASGCCNPPFPILEENVAPESYRPRNKTPTMSRRKSAVFSQLFNAPATLGRSLASSVSSPRNPHGSIDQDTIHRFIPCSYGNKQPFTPVISPILDQSILAQATSLSHDCEFDVPCAVSSPSARSIAEKRRLPIPGLKRVLSLSETEQTNPIAESGDPSHSTRAPDTRINERIPFPHQLQLDFERSQKPSNCPPPPVVIESQRHSFGMRLDSLHFDALSFDVNRF